MKRTKVISVALIAGLTASTLTACAKKQSPRPVRREVVPAGPTYTEHVIQYSGETLAVIAAWYTGRASNWYAIRDANPGLSPQRLRLGQLVQIPNELVIRSEPMPREFVRRFVKGDGKAAPVEGTTPPTETSPGSLPGETAPTTNDETTTEPPVVETTDPVPTPAPTAAPLALPPVEAVTPAPKAETPPSDDAEREKLLDELLK